MAKIKMVTKRDGTLEIYDETKIEAFYKRVAHGFNVKCPYKDLVGSLDTYLIENISTTNIIKLIEKSCIDLISIESPDWERLAGRFKTRNLYRAAARNKNIDNEDLYKPEYFLELINEYSNRKLYNKLILEKYTQEDILRIAGFLDEKIDEQYNQVTVTMYEKRYLLNRDGIIRELPQHMYLVAAMFLMQNEKAEDRDFYIKQCYEMTATGEISLPTPTLLNARTPNSQLSSCFILTPGDDLRNIFHNVENAAQISKNGGGIGMYFGHIRSKGSFIKGVPNLSGGVMPWVKVINDTAIAVNQMGKRSGAISVTLDVFHKDIFHWLDMQTETGDIRAKSFDLFPAVSMPDLFYKRVEEGKSWTLFCPHEVKTVYEGKRLQDHFGEEFEEFYRELEQDPRLTLKETVNAKDLFKTFLKSAVETGMPYVFNRDTVNKLNPNKHAGNIYCTNLCCVTGDTRIATEDGLKTVGELYKTKELIPLKVTTDRRTENLKIDEKGIVVRDSIGIYKTGTLQTYIVDTNSGYQIKATDYHKLYIKDGRKNIKKLELKDIKVGDQLLIQSEKGQFGKDGNYKDGLIMGLTTGDGTYKSKEGLIVDLYNNDIATFSNEVVEHINDNITTSGSGGYQKVKGGIIQHTPNSKKFRVGSERFGRILNDKYSFNRDSKLIVPEKVFSGTEEMIRGYIQGLFATDGTIGKQGGGVQIQLTSINKKLLSDIQILLSNFGIFSSIYIRNTKGKSTFSYTTKDGEYKEYKNKESYRLDINGNNAKKFLDENLIRGIKEERLSIYIKNLSFNKKNFYTTITSINKGEVEDMYDTTENVTNSVIFNGIVSGQCEIAQNQSEATFIEETTEDGDIILKYKMGDTVICNLASINVARVNIPEDIARVTPIAMRLLDNVIDLNAYPTEEARTTAKKYRAVGLGYMGVAEMLAVKKIQYGSEESIEYVDELFKTFAYHTLKSSVELAKERGSYPEFKGSEYSKGIAFGKKINLFDEVGEGISYKGSWKELEDEIKKSGTRFGYHTSPAPNTSTGLVVGTTPGVVPIYKKLYTEPTATGTHVKVAPGLTKENFWHYKEYTKMKMPPVIDVVSTMQKWVDQSISFEFQFNPATTGPADLYAYYFKAWKDGIKTIYYTRSLSLEAGEDCSSCSG